MNGQKIFTSTSDDLAIYNGTVTVLRELRPEEADIDVGKMYECQAASGKTFHAFGDELTDVANGIARATEQE